MSSISDLAKDWKLRKKTRVCLLRLNEDLIKKTKTDVSAVCKEVTEKENRFFSLLPKNVVSVKKKLSELGRDVNKVIESKSEANNQRHKKKAKDNKVVTDSDSDDEIRPVLRRRRIEISDSEESTEEETEIDDESLESWDSETSVRRKRRKRKKAKDRQNKSHPKKKFTRVITISSDDDDEEVDRNKAEENVEACVSSIEEQLPESTPLINCFNQQIIESVISLAFAIDSQNSEKVSSQSSQQDTVNITSHPVTQQQNITPRLVECDFLTKEANLETNSNPEFGVAPCSSCKPPVNKPTQIPHFKVIEIEDFGNTGNTEQKKVFKFPIQEEDISLEQIKSRLSKSSSDIEIIQSDFLRLSLLCPITNQKVKVPAKSKSCQHLDCFDAYSFLKINIKKPEELWRCPKCKEPSSSVNIIIDRLLQNILATEDSFEAVIFNDQGIWKPEGIDKKEDAAKESNSVNIEEIAIDDDDDDDIIPVASVPVKEQILVKMDVDKLNLKIAKTKQPVTAPTSSSQTTAIPATVTHHPSVNQRTNCVDKHPQVRLQSNSTQSSQVQNRHFNAQHAHSQQNKHSKTTQPNQYHNQQLQQNNSQNRQPNMQQNYAPQRQFHPHQNPTVRTSLVNVQAPAQASHSLAQANQRPFANIQNNYYQQGNFNYPLNQQFNYMNNKVNYIQNNFNTAAPQYPVTYYSSNQNHTTQYNNNYIQRSDVYQQPEVQQANVAQRVADERMPPNANEIYKKLSILLREENMKGAPMDFTLTRFRIFCQLCDVQLGYVSNPLGMMSIPSVDTHIVCSKHQKNLENERDQQRRRLDSNAGHSNSYQHTNYSTHRQYNRH